MPTRECDIVLKIKNYARPQSLKEAYELLTAKKSSVVLGGMLWLKMQNKTVHTAIDLQDLGLNTIEETDNNWRIGCMVTLRDLELHPGLQALTHGAMAESVRHIVGVQFRNVATIGGSLYGRFGFSDLLPLFLALDAKVELYHRGKITLEEFTRLPRTEKDLLIRVIVPKTPRRVVYLAQRNSATDFPVLTCAVSLAGVDSRIVVGARPGKAVCLRDIPMDDPQTAAEETAARLTFGSNIRGSAPYREAICRVLVRRALTAMQAQEV